MKRTRSDMVFDVINIALMLVVLVIMLYPLYFVVIASFSEPYDVATGKVRFWFSGFTLEAYKNVFAYTRIWVGYRNTVFYTLFGTLFNLALTIPAAFTLSRKALPGRGTLSWVFLFTMYFGGGLIPTYLLVRDIGLLNTPLTIVILGGLSVYNMVVTRVFFENSIPEELYESVRMDGGNEFCMFFLIALPLSAPIIAVMALYYGVGRWNEFYTALIYLSKAEYYPLQLVLRDILLQNQIMTAGMEMELEEDMKLLLARRAYIAEAMKYSIIFIASAPLLVAYPFVQKYFVKGVMVGSLKG